MYVDYFICMFCLLCGIVFYYCVFLVQVCVLVSYVYQLVCVCVVIVYFVNIYDCLWFVKEDVYMNYDFVCLIL